MDLRKLTFLKYLQIFKRQVYMDHNATTEVSNQVRKKINNTLKSSYGNPSSVYALARKSTEVIDKARKQVAKAINSDPQEIYFTSCATESNNSILKSVSKCFFPTKKKIISTPIEHSSVISTLDFLKTQGIKVEFCPVDHYGRILLKNLESLIDEETFLICCMAANNEIGTIQDIKKITDIAKKYGVLVMSDCVQAIGKIPIDVHDWGLDYASFSAHKLYGPKGCGVTFIKQGSQFVPFIHGGHQENGMRAGTESIHNIAGFGEACKDINKLLKYSGKIEHLKCELVERIKRIKPDCIINSADSGSLPNTISITFPNINNTGLLAMLDFHGIAVSSGSACSSTQDNPSHVLKAIGLTDQSARETIRFSLGHSNSINDIKYTVKIIKKFIENGTNGIDMITPSQLNETYLNDKQLYIVDVRPGIMRKAVKSLPNSHEVSFMSLEKYIHHFPKDKQILVVCQRGHLSFIAAYYLKSKGFSRVCSLNSGVCGWMRQRNDLYQRFGGQNINVLQPVGKIERN